MKAILICLSVFLASCYGAPSDRITNGNEAVPHSRPYMTALYRESGSFTCGSCLISEEWVLTAAHCVDDSTGAFRDVLLGAHDRSVDEPSQVMIRSGEIIMHENYNPFTIRDDVALIKLEVPVNFTDEIQPIKLGQVVPKPGDRVELTGWGSTFNGNGPIPDKLQEIEQSVATREKCVAQFGFMPKDNICTASENGQSVCSGDSGGPLVFEGAVSGINSFVADLDCTNNPYSSYPAVANYLDWICKHSGVCQ